MTALENNISMTSGCVSGLFWAACYLLLIRRAALDRAHAMPLAPLCLNISWEFIFGFVHPQPAPMNYVNMVWGGIDVIILWQYFRYGRAEFPKALPKSWFLPVLGLSLITAFLGVLTLTRELKDWDGNYSGWGAQILISITMISLLAKRGSVEGQSLYIALTRFIGSLAVIPMQYLQTPKSSFLALICVAFTVCDLGYIWLYLRQARMEGINPWTRI